MIAAALNPIYVGFVLLAGLLLWFVIGSRGKWYLKLPTIVFTLLFMFVVWYSLSSFSGWPTSQAPPKASYYLNGYVVEPDPVTNSKGAIYVWLVPSKTDHGVLDYKPSQGEPRAYKLPYSRQLHKEIQEANQAIAHGQQVAFGRGKQQQGGGQAHLGPRRILGQYHPYILPPAGLPRKNTQ